MRRGRERGRKREGKKEVQRQRGSYDRSAAE
jgi:hypothetical protein